MQDRPALFSTFMMWLLAALYESLPEVGDPEKPKLVFFFDEAHLLFRDANKTFMQQIELVARLIRSKGVGVFFVTHSPSDVPAEVLGQLGNRVQHALRAFTPDDLEVGARHGRDVPDHRALRRRGGADRPRHRRGAHHRARPQGPADADGAHDDAAADVAHGAGRAGRLRRRGGRVGDRADLRRPTPTPNRPRSCSPPAWRRRDRCREGADGGRRGSRVAGRAQRCGRRARRSRASTGATWPPRELASRAPGRSTRSCAAILGVLTKGR